jgi:PAS domain S-box-containing protein
MENNKTLEYFDIQNKLAKELSIAIPLEKALEKIWNYTQHLEKIEGLALFKVENNIILSNYINFPESYIREKHEYSFVSPENAILLAGNTVYLEKPFQIDYFQIQTLVPQVFWLIIAPIPLNEDIIGALLLIGTEPLKNKDIFVKIVENVSYKIGGIIGRIEFEKDIFDKQKNIEKLLESFHDIIVITDKEGKIIYSNSIISEKTGYLEEEICSMNIYKLFHEDVYNEINIIIDDLFNSDQQSKILLFPLINSNGEFIPAETIVTKTTWLDKNVLLWSIRDLKERKQAEEEIAIAKKKAEEANIAKTNFIKNLSFALRIPLNSIMGISELLLKTDLNKNQFNFINIIIRSAEQLIHISNQLLDISKIEEGKLELQEKAFSLKDVIIQVVNQQYFKAHNKGIEIICDYINYGDDVVLKADAYRLAQVLQNLIDNAIKFTEKGKIEIDVILKDFDNNFVKIYFSIKDTGIGINQETIQHLYDSFKKNIPVSSKYDVDIGLGLIIAYNILELMGSTLHIESTPGKGTTMSFELKLKVGDISEILTQQVDNKFNVKDKFKNQISVLIAEDEPFNQIVIRVMLEEWGFNVDIVDNGKQVIEKLKQNYYDIILMDIFMPEMNGIQTIKYIRNNLSEPISNIPIIVITANAYISEHQKYIEQGANDTISKPFKSYLLFNKIINLIGISKASLNEFSKYPELDFTISQNQKFYDLELFEKVAKNKKDLMINMLNVFIEKSKQELQQLLEYTENKDWENVANITHKMKPSFAYLSMKQLESLVQEIHFFAKNRENLEKIPKLVKNTKSMLEYTIQLLENEIKNMKQ